MLNVELGCRDTRACQAFQGHLFEFTAHEPPSSILIHSSTTPRIVETIKTERAAMASRFLLTGLVKKEAAVVS